MPLGPSQGDRCARTKSGSVSAAWASTACASSKWYERHLLPVALPRRLPADPFRVVGHGFTAGVGGAARVWGWPRTRRGVGPRRARHDGGGVAVFPSMGVASGAVACRDASRSSSASAAKNASTIFPEVWSWLRALVYSARSAFVIDVGVLALVEQRRVDLVIVHAFAGDRLVVADPAVRRGRLAGEISLEQRSASSKLPISQSFKPKSSRAMSSTGVLVPVFDGAGRDRLRRPRGSGRSPRKSSPVRVACSSLVKRPAVLQLAENRA